MKGENSHPIYYKVSFTDSGIYQEGTPGISLRHCTLSYNFEAKEFILTDLKSTYGTFLMNGQKLALGGSARLKPGDSFYLGDNANVLRVELEG